MPPTPVPHETTAKANRREALRKTVEDMTAAERIVRRFSAGRPMNELRTAQEAIWMASALQHELGEALKAEGLNPEDCYVHIAALTPDLGYLITHKFGSGDAETMKALHGKITSVCSTLVGLIFGVREHDREAIKKHGGRHFVLGAKQFLATKLVAEALEHRIQSDETLQIPGGAK